MGGLLYQSGLDRLTLPTPPPHNPTTADLSTGVRAVASRRGAAATTMMAKNVRLSEKSRQKLVEGINIVANAVKVTLGPKVRRQVVDQVYHNPLVCVFGCLGRGVGLLLTAGPPPSFLPASPHVFWKSKSAHAQNTHPSSTSEH